MQNNLKIFLSLLIFVSLSFSKKKSKNKTRLIEEDNKITFSVTGIDYIQGICEAGVFGPNFAVDLIADASGESISSVTKGNLTLTVSGNDYNFSCSFPIINFGNEEESRTVRIRCQMADLGEDSEGNKIEPQIINSWEITSIKDPSTPTHTGDGVIINVSGNSPTGYSSDKAEKYIALDSNQITDQVVDFKNGDSQNILIKFKTDNGELDETNIPNKVYIGSATLNECEVEDGSTLRCPVQKGQIKSSVDGIKYKISVLNKCGVKEESSLEVLVISAKGNILKYSYIILVLLFLL